MAKLHAILKYKKLDGAFVDSLGETHFIVNVDTNKTLGFRGDENAKYASVASGDDGMTTVIRVPGGQFARFEPAFMIFQNEIRNYPIRGITDDVPGVAYRNGPKGWMAKRVMVSISKSVG